MKKMHQNGEQHEVAEWPGASVGPRPRDKAPRGRNTDDYGDFIARWRRAILRTAAVPAAVKRTLHHLSDHELAIYLAVKCRGGKLSAPAMRPEGQ